MLNMGGTLGQKQGAELMLPLAWITDLEKEKENDWGFIGLFPMNVKRLSSKMSILLAHRGVNGRGGCLI